MTPVVIRKICPSKTGTGTAGLSVLIVKKITIGKRENNENDSTDTFGVQSLNISSAG